MTRFNLMLNSHFKGRPLIASMYDPHRDCQLNIYFIGDDFLVGVSDGVDSWIANHRTSLHAVGDLTQRIENAKKQRRVVVEREPTIRRRVITESSVTIARRKLND